MLDQNLFMNGHLFYIIVIAITKPPREALTQIYHRNEKILYCDLKDIVITIGNHTL